MKKYLCMFLILPLSIFAQTSTYWLQFNRQFDGGIKSWTTLNNVEHILLPIAANRIIDFTVFIYSDPDQNGNIFVSRFDKKAFFSEDVPTHFGKGGYMEIRSNDANSSYLYLASMPYSGWKAAVAGRSKNAGHFDQGYHDLLSPPVTRGWVKVVYTGAPVSTPQPYAIKTKILPIGSWDIHDQNINVSGIKSLDWSSFGVNANRVTYFKALINGDQNGSSGATSRYTDLHRKSFDSDFSTSDGLGDNSGAYAMIDQQINPSQAYMRVQTFGNDYFGSGYYDWENPSVNRGWFRIDYLAGSCAQGAAGFQLKAIPSSTVNNCSAGSGGNLVLVGAGSDIWGNNDEFAYAYKTYTGTANHTFITKVESQGNSSGWAKTGIMVRMGTGANSRHVSMLVTPSNGVQWTIRTTDGGTTDHPHPLNAMKAPIYLRIVKTGTSYVGSYSTNGTNWTQLGSAVSMTTPGTYYSGLAGTSFTTGLNTSQFSSLTF